MRRFFSKYWTGHAWVDAIDASASSPPSVAPLSPSSIATFPHCDQRVLHAPGECRYCDQRGEWQELRVAWGIAFTGHHGPDPDIVLPCPADQAVATGRRGDHQGWAGNVAKP